MATTISTQDIVDAKRDIDDIGKAVNEKVIVSPRYGEDFKSLPMIADDAQATIGEWEAAISLITQEGGVPALAVSTASGDTQQEVNDYVGADWRNKAGGYGTGDRVRLLNGVIVKSTTMGNTLNPNADMTGWSFIDEARLSFFCKADDTDILKSQAFKKAATYCRLREQTLLVDIDVTLVYSEFAEELTSTTFGDYYLACGLIGDKATLNFSGGRFGLMLPSNNSKLKSLGGTSAGWVNTTTNQLVYQGLFYSDGADTSEYENIRYSHIVSASDGTERGGYVVISKNSASVGADDIYGENYLSPFLAMDGESINVGYVEAPNCETGAHIARFERVDVDLVRLKNTRDQASNWAAKNYSTPRHYNGLDGLLVEDSGDVVIGFVDSTWATERGVYVTASTMFVNRAKVVNSSGVKLVGSLTKPAKSATGNDIVCELTDEFTSGDQRALLCCFESYLCDYADLTGRSGCVSTVNTKFWRALVVLSKYTDHSIKKLNVAKACFAEGIGSVVYVALDSRASGVHKVCDAIDILGGDYTFNTTVQNGALLTFRDNEASASAKASFAVTKLSANNPVIKMADILLNVRPNWLADLRYLSAAKLVDIKPDAPFRQLSSGFVAGLNTVVESNNVVLTQNGNIGATITALSSFDFKQGSNITLVEYAADRTLIAEAVFFMYVTSKINIVPFKLSVTGVGYWQLGSALTGTLQATTDAGFNLTHISGATKTNLIGAETIAVNATAGNVEVRGDLQPSKKYIISIEAIK